MTTTRPPAPTGGSWRMARLTAPVVRALAGRRFFPLWAVVHHRGRKTGRELAVPVTVRPAPGVFVIALPWGPGTNWARNVLAAGGCVVRWKGVDLRVDRPELLDAAGARPYYSPRGFAVVERVIGPGAFLLLHRAEDPTRTVAGDRPAERGE